MCPPATLPSRRWFSPRSFAPLGMVEYTLIFHPFWTHYHLKSVTLVQINTWSLFLTKRKHSRWTFRKINSHDKAKDIKKRERERNTQRLQSAALPQKQTEWQPAIVRKGSISTKNQMTKLLIMNEIFLLCWKNSGTAGGLRIKEAIWRAFLKDTIGYPSATRNSTTLQRSDGSGF